MSDETWTPYARQRPAPGTYEWLVPSAAVPGLTVTFYAAMRRRWSGYAEEYSPSFDYWDGWRATVPAGTQWRVPEVTPQLGGDHVYLHVRPAGPLPEPCPYCSRHPRWEALDGGWGGGVAVSGRPHNFNNWRLVCCAWAASPRRQDPRQLLSERAERLAAYRAAAVAAANP